MNGQQLISGGEDKRVCIWDVASRQLVKSILQPGAITNLYLRLISTSRFHPGPKEQKSFADNLKRMISPDDDDDCIELLITEEYANVPRFPEPNFDNSYDGSAGISVSLPDDYEDVTMSDPENDSADIDDQTSETDSSSFQADVKKLRAANARLKLEAKRLMNLNIDQIVNNVQGAKSSKKNKKLRKK